MALNDAIMIVAFAPLVGFLLGLSAITVPWGTLVMLFGFQGEQILQQPLIITMLAVLIQIQVCFNAGLA